MRSLSLVFLRAAGHSLTRDGLGRTLPGSLVLSPPFQTTTTCSPNQPWRMILPKCASGLCELTITSVASLASCSDGNTEVVELGG